MSKAEPLMRARGIVKHFPIRRGVLRRVSGYVRAVDGVDLDVLPGQTMGLVGESGCGKSTLGRTLLRLVEPTAGEITFDGRDLLRLRGRALKRARRDMQIVFQDPMGSLDPRMTVHDIVAEGLSTHRLASGRERDRRIREMLDLVGLPSEAARRAGLGSGCVYSVAGTESPRRAQARSQPDLHICRPQPRRRRLHQRSDCCHVPRQDRRDRRRRGPVPKAAASLHAGSPVGCLATTPGQAPRADRAPRRGAESNQPAIRLPLPDAVSAGSGDLRTA